MLVLVHVLGTDVLVLEVFVLENILSGDAFRAF